MDEEAQTNLTVYPHVLEEDQTAVVVENTDTQTSITVMPNASTAEIVDDLKGNLEHTVPPSSVSGRPSGAKGLPDTFACVQDTICKDDAPLEDKMRCLLGLAIQVFGKELVVYLQQAVEEEKKKCSVQAQTKAAAKEGTPAPEDVQKAVIDLETVCSENLEEAMEVLGGILQYIGDRDDPCYKRPPDFVDIECNIPDPNVCTCKGVVRLTSAEELLAKVRPPQPLPCSQRTPRARERTRCTCKIPQPVSANGRKRKCSIKAEPVVTEKAPECVTATPAAPVEKVAPCPTQESDEIILFSFDLDSPPEALPSPETADQKTKFKYCNRKIMKRNIQVSVGISYVGGGKPDDDDVNVENVPCPDPVNEFVYEYDIDYVESYIQGLGISFKGCQTEKDEFEQALEEVMVEEEDPEDACVCDPWKKIAVPLPGTYILMKKKKPPPSPPPEAAEGAEGEGGEAPPPPPPPPPEEPEPEEAPPPAEPVNLPVYDTKYWKMTEPYMESLHEIFPEEYEKEDICGEETEMPWEDILIPEKCRIKTTKPLICTCPRKRQFSIYVEDRGKPPRKDKGKKDNNNKGPKGPNGKDDDCDKPGKGPNSGNKKKGCGKDAATSGCKDLSKMFSPNNDRSSPKRDNACGCKGGSGSSPGGQTTNKVNLPSKPPKGLISRSRTSAGDSRSRLCGGAESKTVTSKVATSSRKKSEERKEPPEQSYCEKATSTLKPDENKPVDRSDFSHFQRYSCSTSTTNIGQEKAKEVTCSSCKEDYKSSHASSECKEHEEIRKDSSEEEEDRNRKKIRPCSCEIGTSTTKIDVEYDTGTGFQNFFSKESCSTSTSNIAEEKSRCTCTKKGNNLKDAKVPSGAGGVKRSHTTKKCSSSPNVPLGDNKSNSLECARKKSKSFFSPTQGDERDATYKITGKLSKRSSTHRDTSDTSSTDEVKVKAALNIKKQGQPEESLNREINFGTRNNQVLELYSSPVKVDIKGSKTEIGVDSPSVKGKSGILNKPSSEKCICIHNTSASSIKHKSSSSKSSRSKLKKKSSSTSKSDAGSGSKTAPKSPVIAALNAFEQEMRPLREALAQLQKRIYSLDLPDLSSCQSTTKSINATRPYTSPTMSSGPKLTLTIKKPEQERLKRQTSSLCNDNIPATRTKACECEGLFDSSDTSDITDSDDDGAYPLMEILRCLAEKEKEKKAYKRKEKRFASYGSEKCV